MAEKEIITNPSMGSNKLGTETNEERSSGVSAGSDTQLKLTALGGRKHKKEKHKNNDEKSGRNVSNDLKFLEADQTDE
ncbi:MAG TPA: hypothetical protein VIJ95_08870 [Hanamia sp.]